MDSLFSLGDFHFLRPLWLLLLIPAPLLLWLLTNRLQQSGAWQRIIDPRLHSAMLETNSAAKQSSVRVPVWLLWLLAWVLTTIALAGPTYVKMPQPVSKNQQALVILLDMSASMAAQDVSPSRASRAIQKVTDIVRARTDGVTALVVYSGEAHTVTPLTDDTRTIETLLPALSPFIMPAPGSRPEKAVKLARELANNSGIKQADLLLITDGIETQDIPRIKAELRAGLKLSVITLGSEDGAPIPLPNGGFLRDGSGQIVLPSLELAPFKTLSSKLNVRWQSMTLDDNDWQSLISQPHQLKQTNDDAQQEFDLWRDDGFWLILLVLPLVLLLFRRGVLLSLPLALGLGLSIGVTSPADASPWQTADQQGAKLFAQDPQAAAQVFDDNAWRGSAYYRAGDYENAVKAFKQTPESAQALYNLGNALAQSGQYKEAIQAYDQALKKQADFPATVKNKEIVKEALKQQEQQQQDGDDESNSDKSSDKNSNSSDQNSEGNKDQSQDGDKQSQDKNSQQNDDYSPEKSDKNNDSDNNSDSENKESSESESSEKNNEQGVQNADNEDVAREEKTPALAPEGSDSELTREEQEAMHKWLQRVPDNPGKLLQRKFLYQYRQATPEDTDSGEVLW